MTMKASELKKAISENDQILGHVASSWQNDAEVMSWAINPDMWDVYSEESEPEEWPDYKECLGATDSPLVAVVALNDKELEGQEMVYVFENDTWDMHSGRGDGKF